MKRRTAKRVSIPLPPANVKYAATDRPSDARGGRGFRQAYVHEGQGGTPVLLVHGWPETKRIWWRVIEPLVAAGFEVIVPDLRGYGDSELAPDGFYDVPASSHDLHALVHDHLGHDHDQPAETRLMRDREAALLREPIWPRGL